MMYIAHDTLQLLNKNETKLVFCNTHILYRLLSYYSPGERGRMDALSQVFA